MYALINNSQVMHSLAVILLNIGSKYTFTDDQYQKAIFSHPLSKQFIIFVVIFSTTRDVVLSACLTALFATISLTFFNKKSVFHQYIASWGPANIFNKMQMRIPSNKIQNISTNKQNKNNKYEDSPTKNTIPLEDLKCANEYLYASDIMNHI
jgi:hypothetical protein